jgi:hypothetical protein
LIFDTPSFRVIYQMHSFSLYPRALSAAIQVQVLWTYDLSEIK